MPITERPSHTTLHTGPYRAIRLVRRSELHAILLTMPGFRGTTTLRSFRRLPQYDRKYIPPIHHDHLPLPFGRWHRSGLRRRSNPDHFFRLGRKFPTPALSITGRDPSSSMRSRSKVRSRPLYYALC